MIVEELMRKNVVTADPKSSLRQVARLMAEKKVGSVIIVHDGRIAGIVTDRDVVLALSGKRGKDFGDTLVEDVMSRRVHYIPHKARVEKAIDMMLRYEIKKLPVIKDERLVGVITSTDIVAEKPSVMKDIRVHKLVKLCHRLMKLEK